MPFSVSWHTLLDEIDELSDGAELITPISHDRFRITDAQEHRVVVTLDDTGERRPLQRDQFETLYRRIQDSNSEFDLDRLPPDADPYPAVLSLHPRFEIDEERDVIVEKEDGTDTQLLSDEPAFAESERVEPDGIDVYSDALLLIDALERQDVSDLTALETDALVNIYTLCSDVQRNANDFRQEIADVLLDRLHHDQPVHGQYGSVQRTSRRNRSLKDEEEVLATLEDAGIDRERVMSVDSGKVNEALEVAELSETDVYEVEESEYVRKVEVDEDIKESRLQGLKDRLAASSDAESDELRQEIEALEERIDDLTGFSAGTQMQG
jgi:polyhydroxyalkanoate synthesis regulator phasin